VYLSLHSSTLYIRLFVFDPVYLNNRQNTFVGISTKSNKSVIRVHGTAYYAVDISGCLTKFLLWRAEKLRLCQTSYTGRQCFLSVIGPWRRRNIRSHVVYVLVLSTVPCASTTTPSTDRQPTLVGPRSASKNPEKDRVAAVSDICPPSSTFNPQDICPKITTVDIFPLRDFTNPTTKFWDSGYRLSIVSCSSRSEKWAIVCFGIWTHRRKLLITLCLWLGLWLLGLWSSFRVRVNVLG